MEMFRRYYRRGYAWCGVTVLLLSTLGWAIASAHAQQGNADQLADGFLFENAQTFSQALFPASHTLLFKWPLFWLLGVFHNSAAVYSVATVLMALVSVSALAYLLYKIDRRPLVFGTLCLGLASVLVLVPSQVFDGVTAPLSMAMLTGRNLEYLVFIGALVLYIRAKGSRSWQWVAATLLLALLFASDQLFVPLGIGGGLLLSGVAYGRHHRQLLAVAGRWMVGSGMAWLLASVLLWFVNRYATTIAGDPSGPYGPIDNWHSVVPAAVYAIKALLLNYGVTTAAGGLAIIPALMNLVIVAVILAASYKVVRGMSQVDTKRPRHAISAAEMLSAMLLATTAVAFVAYIITTHPYTADARYLTISFFAGFVTLATYLRAVQPKPRIVFAVGGAALLAVILGLISMHRHANQVTASDPLLQRNQRIATALQRHPVRVLVGDYWRVLPIKSMSDHAEQGIIPLYNCLQPVTSLRSNAWQKDLRTHSFAYILSLRPAGTGFHQCDLHMIVFRYGQPSATMIIAGNHRNPVELLLFYDEGASGKGVL